MPDALRNLMGQFDYPPMTGRQLELPYPIPSDIALEDERQALEWAAKRDTETIPMFPETSNVKG